MYMYKRVGAPRRYAGSFAEDRPSLPVPHRYAMA